MRKLFIEFVIRSEDHSATRIYGQLKIRCDTSNSRGCLRLQLAMCKICLEQMLGWQHRDISKHADKQRAQ